MLRFVRQPPGALDGPSAVTAFQRWIGSPLGCTVLEAERRGLAGCLPRTYYPLAVQIGLGNVSLLEGIDAGRRLHVDPRPIAGTTPLVAEWTALPLAPQSIDLVVLPHVLELAANPHEVLREVDGTVASNGVVAVTGFNPISIWGLCRLVRRWSGRAPWSGRILAAGRMQDWLELLDFEIVGGAMAAYRLPVQNQRFVDRTAFLERAGARWWPAFAACYIIVARKRRVGVRLVPAALPARRRWSSGLAQPFVGRYRSGRIASRCSDREVA